MINREIAEKEARRLGCELVEFEQFPRRDDKHLYSVVARRASDNTFIAWIFNISDGGFSTGRYCTEGTAYEWHRYRLGRGECPAQW